MTFNLNFGDVFHVDFEDMKKEEKQTLCDVEESQFFLNEIDYLCQKINNWSYSVIADKCGFPYAKTSVAIQKDGKIYVNKIFPIVSKISWE